MIISLFTYFVNRYLEIFLKNFLIVERMRIYKHKNRPKLKLGAKSLGQHRIIIFVRLRRRFFVRLYKSDAGGLAPVKELLCNMTEKMQASGRKRR